MNLPEKGSNRYKVLVALYRINEKMTAHDILLETTGMNGRSVGKSLSALMEMGLLEREKLTYTLKESTREALSVEFGNSPRLPVPARTATEWKEYKPKPHPRQADLREYHPVGTSSNVAPSVFLWRD